MSEKGQSVSQIQGEKNKEKGQLRSKIQSFGAFLSGMIMPNIGAFIAWGLLTALFMETGYFPNENLDAMRPIMLNYMLPSLIAYTGGRKVHETRGAVIGVVATFGVISAADVPMFAGAMIMGPLAAYVLKIFDGLIEGKVKSGFEMIVNNFSLGILGMILAILANVTFGPVIVGLNEFFTTTFQWLVDQSLTVLMPIILEPARMLFLNNAISQGIAHPMGIQDAAQNGYSIFYLLTSNPGPGLGLLLAYWKFGKGNAKINAPGAAIIHFFGGIHEMYFPYVLMKPILILATIAGWMGSNLFYNLFDAGLVAYPSPGSIVSYMIMTPMGEHIKIIIGVLIGTAISFVIAAFLLRRDKTTYSEEDLAVSTEQMKELKGTNKNQRNESDNISESNESNNSENVGVSFPKDADTIVFACDAGMGSSAMGASVLRKKTEEADLDIEVIHSSIEEIPVSKAEIIVCQENLVDRARNISPNSYFVPITNFVNAPEYDELVNKLKNN